MIRADRFALDVDTFAAERRRILERSDARFLDAVRASLTRLGLPGWEDNIVEMALDIFDETAREEIDEWNPIIDDMRDEFKRELLATLAKTKAVDAEKFDAQVERMVRWLSTYSVNAGTEAATTSDPDGLVGLEWVTMGDSEVRALHVETNGETVPSGQPFSVGEYELLFPGQPVGPPEVWINCRCVARPYLLEDFKVKTAEFTPITGGVDETATAVDGVLLVDQQDSPAFTSVTAAAIDEEDVPDEVKGGDNEDDAPMIPLEEEYEAVPWYGVLAPEGAVSGDNREFENGGLRMRDLPLPIKWMPEDAEGHDKSQVAGRIDRIWREGGLIKAEGQFDTSFAAYEAIRQIAEGSLRGVSVDIDDMKASLAEDGMGSTATGRICSATLCAIPAFAEAFVALGTWADDSGVVPGGSDIPDKQQAENPQTWGAGVIVDEAAVSRETFAPVPIRTKDGPGWITDPAPTRRITDYWVDGPGAVKIGWGAPGDFNRCRVQLVKYVQNPNWLAGLCANLHYRALHVWPGQHNVRTQTMPALTASVEAQTVSGDWFKNPELAGPTPFTVTEDGRVFGHVATWDACHIGLPIDDEENTCTTAPHSETNYAYFLTGEVLTNLGPVAVGQITMGGGHASDKMGVRPAVSHYDSTSSAVADVTAGEDEYGIWVAGVLRSNVTDEQVHDLRAAAISGDWRRVAIGREGNLELVAALAVNVPGFPIPRPSMLVASSGETLTLTAAAIPLHDGQDAGDSIEIPTSPTEKFNAARAKFRQLEITRAKRVFAVSE
jgi:hypothetical protein